jgi:hypothetical protein
MLVQTLDLLEGPRRRYISDGPATLAARADGSIPRPAAR